MNKKCYCLIFSRTHGELKVVSELARGCSARSGQPSAVAGTRLWVTLRRAFWLLGLAFSTPTLAEGIVADGRAVPAQRPEVIATQNGLPQVNINAPNQAGISHNQYQQFDVGQKGAILNNSAVMTQTQLAGYIQGNPKLNPNAAAAKVILNEVNSSNPSQLRGYLEVAGGKAKVIVANPAGILCDGCGTINAGRMTLTTGKPQLNADGSLAGYQIERGAIRITGGGLNGDARNDTEYVDLLARTLEVNAGVWAKEKIAAVAGRNQIDTEVNNITALSASGDRPELAIDMGQMGGMYSGAIRMIGTEAGVGVRNQGGHLQAGKTLTISSEGKLLWQSTAAESYTQAGGDITLTARDTLEHQGKLFSGGQLKVQSHQGEIVQSGTLAAAGDVTLQAKQAIRSSGHLLAGSDTESKLTQPANLTLSSEGDIHASGSLLSQKNVSLSGRNLDISQSSLAAKEAVLTAKSGNVVMKQARVESQQLTVNSAGSLDSQQAQIQAGAWRITAESLFNQGGIWAQTGAEESFFDLSGGLDNSDGSIEARQLSLNSTSLTNLRGKLTALGDSPTSWRISGMLDNQWGLMGSNGSLRLEVGELANRQGKVQSAAGLSLTAEKTLNNDGGELLSGGDLFLQGTQLFNREQGVIQSQQKLNLSLTDALDNQSGQIISAGNSSINAASLNNQQGKIQSLASLEAQLVGSLDNRGGVLFSQGNQHLLAGSLLNSEKGKASTTGALWLELATGLLDNIGGQLLAGEQLQIDAGQIDNRSGLLYSEGVLQLTSTSSLDNSSGTLQSGGDTRIHAASLLNTEGTISSQQQLDIRLSGMLNNSQGSLRANQALLLAASQLENEQGTINSGGTLQATAASLNNQSGTIISQAAGNYQLEALDNRQGKLHSGGTLTLNGGSIDNRGGQLVAMQALIFTGKTLDNSANGTLSSQQALTLQAGRIDNSDGGRLIGTTSLSAVADSLNNNAGRVQSTGTLTLALRQTLDNQQGSLVSGQDLQLDSSTALRLLNQSGRIESNGALSIAAETLENQNGTLLSQQTLTLDLQQDYIHRAGETLSSNSALILTIHGTFTNLADWLLPGRLTLNSEHITNLATLVSKTASLTTGKLLNQGRIEADSLTLQSDSLDNRATLMGDEIDVSSRLIDNHGGGALIAATEKLSLRTGESLLNRDGGFIYSGGTLVLKSGDLIENRASNIEAEGDIMLEARRFNNLREGLEIEREAEQSEYNWHRYNYFWRAYETASITDPIAPSTQRLTFQDLNAAENNPYGTIINIDAAGKRAEIKVKNAQGEMINLWVNYLALVPNEDGSYSMSFYEAQGTRRQTVPTPYHQTVWREHDKGRMEQWDPQQHLDFTSSRFVEDYSLLRERSVTGTLTTDRLVSAGTGATLLSGGAMTLRISQQLLNDASVISANGALSIEGSGNIVNQGYSVNERREEFIVDHYDKSGSHWYPTYNFDETTALTTIDGVISGFGKVILTGAHIENTTVNQAQISQAEAAQNVAEAERAEWQRNPLAADSAALPGELQLTGQQHLAGVATSIPNNALFRQQTAAGSPYLVVTDPRFTDKSQFISSDYMLELIGYDPSQVLKRLGDGYYEQRVVREQLLMLTGRPSEKGEDAMALYQQLMNNGVKTATDFQLVPGVALTPAQIAALEQDIVWLVSETVETTDGPQTVWVPKVYLANTTVRLTGDGAIIGGGSLQLSADSISNAGNLFSDTALAIDSSLFAQQGGDIRADSINVKADNLSLSTDLQNALRQASMSARELTLTGGDISLKGASLTATENLSLSASNILSVGAARSSKTAELEVIAGAMGNRKSEGMEEAGKRMAQVGGEWQQALGSSLSAGGSLNLQAGQDISVQGSQARADGTLTVKAGGNVSLLTETTTNSTHLQANSSTSSVSNSRQEERLLGSSLSGGEGVVIQAGGDFAAVGSQVASSQGGIALSAKQVTIEEARQQINDQDSEHNRVGLTTSQRQMTTESNTGSGSGFSAQGDIAIIAREGDIRVQGSSVESEKGAVGLSAAGDIAIAASQDTRERQLSGSSKSSGTLSSKQNAYQQQEQSSTASGSLISGQAVTLESGRNISVAGSSVVATDDVSLKAGNDITVTTAENYYHAESASQSKKSGISGTGGIGFSIGTNKLKTQDSETSLTHTGSTIGSTSGSVTISAGNGLTVKGSDVLAGKDISLTGKEVNILAAENSLSQTHKTEQKQSGLTVALSGTAGSALNSAVTTVNEARKESDGRLAALQGIKAALSGVSAQQAYELDGLQTSAAEAKNAAAGLKPGDEGYEKGATNTVGVSISYGSQSSKSESSLTQTTQQGSSLTAGNNLSITATGTDINVQGSRLQAGKDVQLSANRDVNLVSAEESSSTRSQNSSKGGSVGVGITAGSGGAGLNVSASVNKGKGHENADSVSHVETQVNAGSQVTIVSGRDTTLTGAQVSGEAVKADVGRNLTISSEQDSETYDAKQQSASAGVGYTVGGAATASVSATRDKMNSNWRSVTEQSGIFAGAGGFDITVGEHTQLDGAVIASTATADKNTLDTGTLGWRDIENHAEYSVEHVGAGISTGGTLLDQFKGNMANGVLAGLNGSDSADSVTKAAVSEGTIVIRDKEKQTQEVADLSRDVENANPGLEQIFDKEKEQNRLKAAQLIAEIGSQALDIARTEGQIAATKAANEKVASATQSDRDKALADLKKQDPTKQYSEADISRQVYDNFYNQAFAESGLGTGGKVQQAIQAATAAIQGLAGGNIAQAVSGAAAPYLAEVIKQTAPDETSRVMAHAVVAGVAAAAQGNSALAGAAGAATTAAMGEAIKTTLYGNVPVSQLSEEQKQTLVALGTVAAGLAGGLTGNSTADAVAGAQAGQNETSNNMVSMGMLQMMQAKSLLDAAAVAEAGKGGANEQAALALTKAVKEGLDAACVANPSCLLMAVVAAQQNGGSDSNGSTPDIGKNLTDTEKAELGGAGSGAPGGWEPQDEEQARNSEAVKQQQQNHFDELSKLYDKSNASQNLNIDGQTIRQGEMSNNYGTTKVFESQNLTDQQIHKYAQQLAGETPLKEVRPGIYTAKLDNGTSITLRNVSSSQNQTGARWTIDIKGNKQLSDITYKFKDVEMKFK